MSLLLEALKKAEKAKEEAQRRQGGEAAAAPSSRAELSLQQAPASEPKHVVMRSELPDIHQPLEILSDDISPPARAPDPRPAPASASAGAGTRGGARPPREEAPAEAGRASARKAFEVKYREPNPRLPFFITLGALGVAAVGVVVYFWFQLQPPRMLVNPNPSPAAVAAAPAAPAPATPAPSSPAASPGTGPLAGLPGVPASVTPPAPAQPAPAPRGPRPSAIPSDAPPPAAARPARAPAAPIATSSATEAAPQLSFARPVAQVHPQVEAAYAAFIGGDLKAARSAYEAALRDEPANRDALLGLAATDVRSGRFEAAEAAYVRLLRADPRDAHAQAGLIGLRSARLDPLAAESRVKNLLAADPGAHVLHFALGNQLAQQGRWPEAQQHYFKAHSAEPDHPDFAFNLAVSLDHMRQFKLARQYYARAVDLASKRSASFDVAAAQERVKQLPD
jgi:Flp pilus assembly protein TadD